MTWCIERRGEERFLRKERPIEDMTEPRDLVFREKRIGLRTEPWGTPVVRVRGADTDPLHVTW